MRWSLTAVIIIIIAVSSSAFDKSWADDLRAELLISPDGHRFSFLQMPQARKVSLKIAWPMPWGLTSGRNPAVPRLGADLVMQGGAGDMTPVEVEQRYEALSANAYLTASPDCLYSSILAPPDSLEETVSVTNTALTKPRLDPAWHKRIGFRLIADMAKIRKQPDKQGERSLQYALFGDQPVTHSLGSLDDDSQSFLDDKDINSVSEGDIRDWLRKTVTSRGAVIAVAGPIDSVTAGRLIDKLLANLAGYAAPELPVVIADNQPRRVFLHSADATETTVIMAARVPESGIQSYYNDLIGMFILGGNSGYLTEAVRGKLRASYGFSLALKYYTQKDRYLFISSDVKAKKLPEIISAMSQAYSRMSQQPASTDTLKRWITEIAQQIQQNNPSARAKLMLDVMMEEPDLSETDLSAIADRKLMLDKVTPSDIQRRYAQDYPQPKDLIFVIVSPDKKAPPGFCKISNPQEAARCP